METDSLETVEALSKGTEYVVEVGDVLHSCHCIMRDYVGFKVQHISRQANRLAHAIAKSDVLSGSVDVFYTPPSGLLELLMYDASS